MVNLFPEKDLETTWKKQAIAVDRNRPTAQVRSLPSRGLFSAFTRREHDAAWDGHVCRGEGGPSCPRRKGDLVVTKEAAMIAMQVVANVSRKEPSPREWGSAFCGVEHERCSSQLEFIEVLFYGDPGAPVECDISDVEACGRELRELLRRQDF